MAGLGAGFIFFAIATIKTAERSRSQPDKKKTATLSGGRP
jgi:hypothetical protein